MPNGDDLVQVNGPDGKQYQFPSGTTKDAAIAYFKKKGIGAAAPSTPPKTQAPPASAPQSKDQTTFQKLNQGTQALQDSIQRWRPRWDNPKVLLQDPTWYGRSAKYLGGEAIGAGKAAAGVLTGTTKLLNDAIASIDPVELYNRPQGEPAQQFEKDLINIPKGVLDLGKTSYDLLRHFPESASDPEAVGSAVANMAMTVDGGVKGAKAIADHLGFNPAEAVASAKQLSKSSVDGLLRQRATEDAYVHKNGVGIAKDITSAVQEANKEVKAHVDNLAQIDKNVPAGVIDASKEADVIKDAFKDIVKTPDPLNRTLNDMVQDAKNTAPGQWSFEKVRQFRSKVGRALNTMKGPDYAVGSRVYQDLTQKLSGVAKKYGLSDSWNQYNELEKKINKSFGIINDAQDIVDTNGEGAKMAAALKDKAAVKEVNESLQQYGLDPEKVIDYARKADKIQSRRGGSYKSIFKQVYGLPGGFVGLPVMAALREGGAGYPASIGAAALAGMGTAYLIHAVRAAMLSPEILDGILEERKWPGKLALPKGDFPPGEASNEGVAGPEPLGPTGPTKPSLPSPRVPESTMAQPPTTSRGTPTGEATIFEGKNTPLPKDLHEVLEKQAGRKLSDEEALALDRANLERQMGSGVGKPDETSKIREQKRAELEKPDPERYKPKVTKVPEGEHGTGKLARTAKQRERVAAVRKEKGSTALGGGTQEISGGDVAADIAKTQERLATPNKDLSQLQIPEMEEALKAKAPKDYAMLQKFKKNRQITDEEYQQGLRHFLLIAYEDDLREHYE